MADPTTKERLRGLVLSANDLKALTDWPGALIEDYLNILDNLITISNLLDIEIDQKIEEVPTDFVDGSIPFADDGFLIEDLGINWDNTLKQLVLANLRVDGSIYLSTVEKSNDYTILDDDSVLHIEMTTGATDKTIDMPTLADNPGRVILISKVDSGIGKAIVDGEGAETINGDLTLEIWHHGSTAQIKAGPNEWTII